MCFASGKTPSWIAQRMFYCRSGLIPICGPGRLGIFPSLCAPQGNRLGLHSRDPRRNCTEFARVCVIHQGFRVARVCAFHERFSFASVCVAHEGFVQDLLTFALLRRIRAVRRSAPSLLQPGHFEEMSLINDNFVESDRKDPQRATCSDDTW